MKSISGAYTSDADNGFLSSFIHQQVFQGKQLSPASAGQHSVLDRPRDRPTDNWGRSDAYVSANAEAQKPEYFSPQSF